MRLSGLSRRWLNLKWRFLSLPRTTSSSLPCLNLGRLIRMSIILAAVLLDIYLFRIYLKTARVFGNIDFVVLNEVSGLASLYVEAFF